MSRFVPQELRGFPQVAEYNWVIHGRMHTFLRYAAERYACGVLVDIGCGCKPWESIFEPHVTEHLGVDVADSAYGKASVDIIGTADATGLPEAQVDTILCTEVLEHVADPEAALWEMHRILSPGGVVILTVPFFWHVHEAPRDFYRFTVFGLRYIFEQAGFELIEIRPLTGFIITFGQLLAYYNRRFAKGHISRCIIRFVNWSIQHISSALDRFDNSPEFTCLYGVIARKKSVAA